MLLLLDSPYNYFTKQNGIDLLSFYLYELSEEWSLKIFFFGYFCWNLSNDMIFAVAFIDYNDFNQVHWHFILHVISFLRWSFESAGEMNFIRLFIVCYILEKWLQSTTIFLWLFTSTQITHIPFHIHNPLYHTHPTVSDITWFHLHVLPQ